MKKKRLSHALIRFYKTSLNPLMQNNCRFVPSCSSYAYQAIEKHGIIKGGTLAAYRIMRCNPFSIGGFDPVKENIKGRAKWLL
ncbi:MAG: membrane protein insertion efficiency factor YidD [Clostridia bacterium]|nr:membrane protein insertion efficiency factor YidD [Clostridia bacterium]MCX4367233.1 membrane protein insertion efficiency factor YidD [Clostridia bacterium]